MVVIAWLMVEPAIPSHACAVVALEELAACWVIWR